MTRPPDYEWRRAMINETGDHLTRVGAAWQYSRSSMRARAYVESVCGGTAAPDVLPVGVPCASCGAWLAGHPEVRVLCR